jgi:hypothetical protein
MVKASARRRVEDVVFMVRVALPSLNGLAGIVLPLIKSGRRGHTPPFLLKEVHNLWFQGVFFIYLLDKQNPLGLLLRRFAKRLRQRMATERRS